MRLLRPKVTFLHFSDFGAQKSLFGEKSLLNEKVTFGLPGLEKGSISHWFLKGWEPSARTATFDDGKISFAQDFTKIARMFLDFLRNPFPEMQKRVPISDRRRMTVSSRVRTGPRLPLFAKNAKLRKFHFFEFWSENEQKSYFFDFRAPKATFRAQARGCACSQCFLDAFSVPGN